MLVPRVIRRSNVALISAAVSCFFLLTLTTDPILDALGAEFRPVGIAFDRLSNAVTPITRLPTLRQQYGNNSNEVNLHDQLREWTESPVLTYPQLVQSGKGRCSRTGTFHPRYFNQRNSWFWQGLRRTEVLEARSRITAALEEVILSSAGDSLNNDRGIVFIAGDDYSIARAILSLRYIRQQLNCSLAAQIFSFPGEISPEAKQKLDAHHVSLKVEHAEVLDRTKDLNAWKSYEIKAKAILQSRFRHVLYLDSDNIPILDPTHLFDSSAYIYYGALFWPDFWQTAPHNQIWNILGIPCQDGWELETGQIVIDKKRHIDALLLADLMQKDHKFWFRFSDGDKDTFRYAFYALGKTWAWPGRHVGSVGYIQSRNEPFCGHTMIQHDEIGRPLFVHWNLLKDIGDQARPAMLWTQTQRPCGREGWPERGGRDTNGDFPLIETYFHDDARARPMCLSLREVGTRSAMESNHSVLEIIPADEEFELFERRYKELSKGVLS